MTTFNDLLQELDLAYSRCEAHDVPLQVSRVVRSARDLAANLALQHGEPAAAPCLWCGHPFAPRELQGDPLCEQCWTDHWKELSESCEREKHHPGDQRATRHRAGHDARQADRPAPPA